MKAVEFVKNFGLGKAKGIVAVMTDGTVNYDGESVGYSDLKQIVDAFELVGSHGGLRRAKLSCGYPSSDKSGTVGRLNNAISLVEQCQ